MLGVVFPGQGTQRVGAVSWFAHAGPTKEVFSVVSHAAERDLLELFTRGPKTALDDTRYAQPAIFAANAALHALLVDKGVAADIVAGHSVGELNAIVAAGSLTLEQGAELVSRRGAAMAAVSARGAMAGILGLSLAEVTECCARIAGDGVLVVALANGSSEYVISGDSEAVERAMSMARAMGAARVVPLATSNAFHSPLMRPALPEWCRIVDAAPFAQPTLPLVLNTTGDLGPDVRTIREAVRDQVVSPVRWHDVMLAFVRASVSTVVECGASRALAAIARRLDTEWKCVSLDAPSGLRALEHSAVRSAT